MLIIYEIVRWVAVHLFTMEDRCGSFSLHSPLAAPIRSSHIKCNTVV